MNKYLLNLVLLLALHGVCHAQQQVQVMSAPAPEVTGVVAELQSAFSTLERPRITSGILLDQAAPTARFTGHQYYRADSANSYRNWEQQYLEFYNAALNSTSSRLL